MHVVFCFALLCFALLCFALLCVKQQGSSLVSLSVGVFWDASPLFLEFWVGLGPGCQVVGCWRFSCVFSRFFLFLFLYDRDFPLLFPSRLVSSRLRTSRFVSFPLVSFRFRFVSFRSILLRFLRNPISSSRVEARLRLGPSTPLVRTRLLPTARGVVWEPTQPTNFFDFSSMPRPAGTLARR